MKSEPISATRPAPRLREVESRVLNIHTEHLAFRSGGPMAFLDLTDRIQDCVVRSGVEHGLVNLQCLHTSAALVVNEDEPLLHADFKALLGRFAPRDAGWQHDRLDVRTVNMTPEETPNAHAHARALVLRSTECLNIADGRITLGRWQRIFFLECDDARDREVSVMVMGAGRA
jgi:secondary thiamine-phosphate synthase enzyme